MFRDNLTNRNVTSSNYVSAITINRGVPQLLDNRGFNVGSIKRSGCDALNVQNCGDRFIISWDDGKTGQYSVAGQFDRWI